MARIDFYVVTDSGESARQRFACRLAEKAYRLNNTVHIEVDDTASARAVDALLWTFRDGSFVPHELLENSTTSATAPITIGGDPPSHLAPDLVINLTCRIPANVDAFARVAEIVTSDDDSKSRSRKNFAAYRDAGHTLETHKI